MNEIMCFLIYFFKSYKFGAFLYTHLGLPFYYIQTDVGLLGNLLCAARTPALQKLFRTHTRTAPRFLMIAPAPALFQKISALLQLFLLLFLFY